MTTFSDQHKKVSCVAKEQNWKRQNCLLTCFPALCSCVLFSPFLQIYQKQKDRKLLAPCTIFNKSKSHLQATWFICLNFLSSQFTEVIASDGSEKHQGQSSTVAIERPNYNPPKNAVMCSIHFISSYFKSNGKAKRLKEDAIPTELMSGSFNGTCLYCNILAGFEL